MTLPLKATEIRNHIVVISRLVTNVSTLPSYLNFLYPKLCQNAVNRWYSILDELPWQNYSQCRFFGSEIACHVNILCPRFVFCRADWWCCVVERREEVQFRLWALFGWNMAQKVLFPFSHAARRCVPNNKDAYVVARLDDVISEWRASITGAISGACPT